MDEFLKVHAELLILRKEIAKHDYAITLLRQKERELEQQSNFHFHEMARRAGNAGQKYSKPTAPIGEFWPEK